MILSKIIIYINNFSKKIANNCLNPSYLEGFFFLNYIMDFVKKGDLKLKKKNDSNLQSKILLRWEQIRAKGVVNHNSLDTLAYFSKDFSDLVKRLASNRLQVILL